MDQILMAPWPKRLANSVQARFAGPVSGAVNLRWVPALSPSQFFIRIFGLKALSRATFGEDSGDLLLLALIGTVIYDLASFISKKPFLTLLYIALFGVALAWSTTWTANSFRQLAPTKLPREPHVDRFRGLAYIIGLVLIMTVGIINWQSAQKVVEYAAIVGHSLAWGLFLLPTGAEWLAIVCVACINSGHLVLCAFGDSGRPPARLRRSASIRKWLSQAIVSYFIFMAFALLLFRQEISAYARLTPGELAFAYFVPVILFGPLLNTWLLWVRLKDLLLRSYESKIDSGNSGGIAELQLEYLAVMSLDEQLWKEGVWLTVFSLVAAISKTLNWDDLLKGRIPFIPTDRQAWISLAVALAVCFITCAGYARHARLDWIEFRKQAQQGIL